MLVSDKVYGMDEIIDRYWKCIRCEIVNDAESYTICEVCGTPRLYTQEEVDAVIHRAKLQQLQQVVAEWEWLQRERTHLHAAQRQLAEERQQFEDARHCATTPTTLRRTIPASTARASGDVTLAKSFTNSLGMEFVLLPAGEFQMGSNDFNDAKPVHMVCISRPLYLGRYPVTQEQWQMVMGNNPSYFTGDPNRPVEQISWEDVQRFIDKLNLRERRNRYRLPTEAEWEYAVRAGTTTAYSFGNDTRQLRRYAWYTNNAGHMTHPVGQKQPNAWGLYDMHGNVWEWVQDWYGSYTGGAVTDPQGPPSGSDRVIRGGGWLDDAGDCRSAYRIYAAPGSRYDGLGFRLLRMAE
jgi:formylglycine-generating enzyme required for sulfatase activity